MIVGRPQRTLQRLISRPKPTPTKELRYFVLVIFLLLHSTIFTNTSPTFSLPLQQTLVLSLSPSLSPSPFFSLYTVSF